MVPVNTNMIPYIGRFAPSPTGPLHFGSLVAALASYLDARSQRGQWLVRMEDIDPPRETPGAADIILRQLEHHGLLWDGEVLYQSHRTEAYEAALDKLQRNGLLYRCDCSRQKIQETGGIYNRHCRNRLSPPETNFALRIKVDLPLSEIIYTDIFQGEQQQELSSATGDYVVKRRDGYYAYQLAVSVDDAAQKISHVIRGADLLDSTPRQIYLLKQLGVPAPEYGHIPMATQAGQKISKQNLAKAMSTETAAKNLISAMDWLNMAAPRQLADSQVDEILHWAIANWQRQRVPQRLELPAP